MSKIAQRAAVAPFAWPIGVVIGAALYYILMIGRPVIGEPPAPEVPAAAEPAAT